MTLLCIGCNVTQIVSQMSIKMLNKTKCRVVTSWLLVLVKNVEVFISICLTVILS